MLFRRTAQVESPIITEAIQVEASHVEVGQVAVVELSPAHLIVFISVFLYFLYLLHKRHGIFDKIVKSRLFMRAEGFFLALFCYFIKQTGRIIDAEVSKVLTFSFYKNIRKSKKSKNYFSFLYAFSILASIYCGFVLVHFAVALFEGKIADENIFTILINSCKNVAISIYNFFYAGFVLIRFYLNQVYLTIRHGFKKA